MVSLVSINQILKLAFCKFFYHFVNDLGKKIYKKEQFMSYAIIIDCIWHMSLL